MDTRDLTSALREATDGLEPRTDFAATVLQGGRRRRTRGRIAVGAALAGTAAVAVVAAVVVPNQMSAPPPADQRDGPAKADIILSASGGNLIDDKRFTGLAVTAWRDSVERTPANKDGELDGRKGEPHVYWAGDTPAGPSALVAQEVGRGRVAVGLLITNPADLAPGATKVKRELELVGVQVDAGSSALGGFLLHDDRTLMAIDPVRLKGENLSMFASANTTVGADDRSRRRWTRMTEADGVALTQLPVKANPHNVRLAVADTHGDPNQGEQKMGAHVPVLSASVYTGMSLSVVPDRGLPWAPEEWPLLDTSHPVAHPLDAFDDALRGSGLLDPASYAKEGPRWVAAVGLTGGRSMIVSTQQELDNPAYLFSVLRRADGSVEKVTREAQLDPRSGLPVTLRLPDGQGWVVAIAPGKELRYRTVGNGQWSAPASGTRVIPAGAVVVQVDGQDYPLA
jgi:hypothetical protein